jgi:hypothetical protein
MINTGFHAKNSSFSKFCPKKVGGNNSWWEGAGEGFASRQHLSKSYKKFLGFSKLFKEMFTTHAILHNPFIFCD